MGGGKGVRKSGSAQGRASAPAQATSQGGAAGHGNSARAQEITGQVTASNWDDGILRVKIGALEGGSAEQIGAGASFQTGGASNLWGETTKVGRGWVRGEIDTPDLSANEAVKQDGTVRFRSLPSAPKTAPAPVVESVPLSEDLAEEQGNTDRAMEAERDAHLEGADGGMAAEEEERFREEQEREEFHSDKVH